MTALSLVLNVGACTTSCQEKNHCFARPTENSQIAGKRICRIDTELPVLRLKGQQINDRDSVSWASIRVRTISRRHKKSVSWLWRPNHYPAVLCFGNNIKICLHTSFQQFLGIFNYTVLKGIIVGFKPEPRFIGNPNPVIFRSW